MLPGDSQALADLLDVCWASLGGAAGAIDALDVAGVGAGLQPSRLACLPVAVAAVAASTLAARELAIARGMPAGAARCEVDIDHVALAATSERFARAPEVQPQELFGPMSRFWGTADGWIRLHGNYSWHRDRILRVLGLEGGSPDPAVVAEAIARWPGDRLEDELAAAGAPGFLVRTVQDWRSHQVGAAVAAAPLIGWTDAGSGPGRPSVGPGDGSGPAAGVRVVDLTRVIAGPVATRTLAAWGADVLRIDPPQLPELSTLTIDALAGKRSARLDLGGPTARGKLHALLGEADVLVHGYRPGSLDRFGLSEADLAQRHPHLVVVSLSAWGRSHPWAGRRGFDSTVQAAAGIAVLEGNGDGRPGALPAQILDHSTGYLAAAAALLALAEVAGGGTARHAHLSLAATANWLLSAGVFAPDRDADGPGETPAPLTPGQYQIELDGIPGGATVVAPPGRLAGWTPRWRGITRMGADKAVWATAPSSLRPPGPPLA